MMKTSILIFAFVLASFEISFCQNQYYNGYNNTVDYDQFFKDINEINGNFRKKANEINRHLSLSYKYESNYGKNIYCIVTGTRLSGIGDVSAFIENADNRKQLRVSKMRTGFSIVIGNDGWNLRYKDKIVTIVDGEKIYTHIVGVSDKMNIDEWVVYKKSIINSYNSTRNSGLRKTSGMSDIETPTDAYVYDPDAYGGVGGYVKKGTNSGNSQNFNVSPNNTSAHSSYTVCYTCQGMRSCKVCKGTKFVSDGFGLGTRSLCSACGGTGKCWHCKGTGKQ